MFLNIIGGSGFIGTRLCRRLKTGSRVPFSIIDKSTSKAFPDLTKIADVRSVDELRSTISDGAVIINLAAEHRDDVRPLSMYDDVNVEGARNICLVASEKNVKTIVFTSSVAVYGFAPIGTLEDGKISPFNDYGRTKYEAELVFRSWQAERPTERTLVVLRPTVVFGEQNRGNVYNLLKQIADGKFLMIGDGENRKSIAYVENVVAFLEFATSFLPGIHTYNFIDKPDFTMNALVITVNKIMGRPQKIGVRLPYWLGFSIGKCFDLLAAISGKKMTISSIRVKKFCSNSVFDTSIHKTGFVAPFALDNALTQTVIHEFLESNNGETVFYTE